MEPHRPWTSDSQQSIAMAQQPVPYSENAGLDHSAPEVVQRPLEEKQIFHSPSPSSNAYPPTTRRDDHMYWTTPDLENIPPQYPGTQGGYPVALAVPPIVQPAEGEETLCGMKKRLFLLFLALGGLGLLAIAVGVGVGVGLGNHNSAAVTTSGGTGSHNISSQTTAPAVPAPTESGSSSTGAANFCPDGGVSNTQYTATNNKKFLHLCGIDYSGTDEATDLKHKKTATFDDCMEACAALGNCTGAGWGASTGKYANTCWMKSSLKKSHTATPDWNFAVLLAGVPTNATSSSPSSSPQASSG